MGLGIRGTTTAALPPVAPPRIVAQHSAQSLDVQIARFPTLSSAAKYPAIDAIFDALHGDDPASYHQILNWATTQAKELRSRGLRINMVNAAQRAFLSDPAARDDDTFAAHFAFATTLYECVEPSVHDDFVRRNREAVCRPAWRLYLYHYFCGPEDRDTYCDFVQSSDPFAWYERWREKATPYRYGQSGPWHGASKECKLAAWFALDRPRRDQYRFPYAYENDDPRRPEKLTWPFFTDRLSDKRFSELPASILTEGFAFTVPMASEPVLLSGEIAEQLLWTMCDKYALIDRLRTILKGWPTEIRRLFSADIAQNFTVEQFRLLLIRHAHLPQIQATLILPLLASYTVAQQSDNDDPSLSDLVWDYQQWLDGHWKKVPPQLEAELLPHLLAHQTAVVAQLEDWATQDRAHVSIWRTAIAQAHGRVARLQHLQQRLETRTWHDAVVEVIPTRAPLDLFLPYQNEDCEKGDLDFFWDLAYQPMRIIVDRMWQGGLYVARGWRRDLFISLGPREQLMVEPRIFLRRMLQGMSVLGARADLNVLLPVDVTAQGNRVSMLWEIEQQSWLPSEQPPKFVHRRFGLSRLFETSRGRYYKIHGRGDPADTDGITILRPTRNTGQWRQMPLAPG